MPSVTSSLKYVPYTCRTEAYYYFFFLICDVLKETEKIFRQEVNCLEAIEEVNLRTTPDSEPDISSVLSAYNR